MAKKLQGFSKIKWEKLGGSGNSFKFEDEGKTLTGVYVGSKTIKIEERPVRVHLIDAGDGAEPREVLGTVLNNLEALPLKTPVRIKYLGMRGKGARKYKNFQIEYPEGTKVKEIQRSKPRKGGRKGKK